MADNIPLDRDVEGTIVYPLSDETGLRLDETVDTRLYQIYEALLGNSSVGTQIDGSLNAQLGQIYVALLGYGDTFTQIKDAIDAGMGGTDDAAQIKDAIEDGLAQVVAGLSNDADATSVVNMTLDTGLGQICTKLDGNGDIATEMKTAIDDGFGLIQTALGDNGDVGATIRAAIEDGLAQVVTWLSNNGDVGTSIEGTLDAKLEQIYQALLDDGYVLPTATDSLLGGVKIDGVTIQIRNGVISVVNPLEYMSAETIVRLTPFAESGQTPEEPEEPLEDQVYVEDDVMYMLSSSAEGAIGISVRDGYVNLDAPTDVVDVFEYNDMLQIYTDGTTQVK